MCGIAGIRRFDGQPVDRNSLGAMVRQLEHRGPDDEGIWQDVTVGFAHRRLSIIDVSGSRQPMGNEVAWICFNGEIFNYKELRQSLVDRGYRFNTGGDTEVILALHTLEGPESVEKLDGQFAYAIYDKRDRCLWLHRDRMGILPLFYYWDGTTFIFASEIKAILPVLPKEPEIDFESVKEYLGYRSVPSPNTLFRGIKKLQPGNRLKLDCSGVLKVEKYWAVPPGTIQDHCNTRGAIEQVSFALEQAVKSRLVADVPVGAYLSGGLDSSLVVALMSQLRDGEPVDTFSAGFADPKYDELPYAREVSRTFRTRHHEVVVQPKDFEDLWPRLTWHRDAPISEASDMAVFSIADLARQTVKVLLSGEGSDELFAGYPKYRFARWASSCDFLPSAMKSAVLRRVERALPDRLSKLRIMLRAMTARTEAERFQTWFSPFTSYERDQLMAGAERVGNDEIWSHARGNLIQRMLFVDSHTWLTDNLLERGDRMSMAASVEVRPPFLDHKLVELAFSLPSSVKVRNGTTKWIVKKVAESLVNPSIINRKKMGFTVPLGVWFRRGLRDLSSDLLLSPNSFVSQTMDHTFVRQLLEDHQSGRRDEANRIWTLMCLEVWHQVFFKQLYVANPHANHTLERFPFNLAHNQLRRSS